MRLALSMVLAGLVPMLAGCAEPELEAERLGRVSSAVLRGTPSGASDDAVVALAVVHNDTLYSLCTATLVAPNLAITARHCLAITDEATVCRDDGTPLKGATVHEEFLAPNLLFYTGRELGDRWMEPSLAVARGAFIVREDASTTCNRDVAFVVLDRDVPGRFAKLRVSGPATVGESLSVVGYGVTETGALSPRRLRRDGVTVLGVGPGPYSPVVPGAGIGSSELVVGESICAGDSGGPAFAATGALVGVVGRGGNGVGSASNLALACSGPDARNVYMQLFEKPALVAEAFARAGRTPRTENDRARVEAGVACEQSFDCTTDACIGGVCAARCEERECTGGLACGAFEDMLACQDPRTLPGAARGSGCNAGPRHRESSWGTLALAVTGALLLARRRRLRITS